jgi:hypothetical protein
MFASLRAACHVTYSFCSSVRSVVFSGGIASRAGAHALKSGFSPSSCDAISAMI